MTRLYIVLAPIVFALWVFCVIDVISSRDGEARHLPKVGWLLLVLLFPLVGSIAWLVAGRPVKPKQARGGTSAAFPEYDRPGRAQGITPESDEEFLRRVRERAEEQRRMAAEQNKPTDPDDE